MTLAGKACLRGGTPCLPAEALRARWAGRALLVGMLMLAGAARPTAQDRPAPTRTEIAPGIHLFRTAPYGDVGLDGNSIAIISTNGVLVFDTNGTPSAAAAVLAEIRKLTPQPVRYVVNSHWHWDHWYGTEVYARAFPGRDDRRAREDAGDDGGTGDRVQPARARIAVARLSREHRAAHCQGRGGRRRRRRSCRGSSRRSRTAGSSSTRRSRCSTRCRR